MKNLIPCALLALIALTGCGAAGDDATQLDLADNANELAELGDDAAAQDAEDVALEDGLVADSETLGTSQQALINGGAGSLGAKRWCAARKTCYDQCDVDFPVGDSTNTSCKSRCDISTAPKCRPDTAAGGGLFIL